MSPHEASRLRALAVTLEPFFRRESGDADVQTAAIGAARIAIAEGTDLPDRRIELYGVDAVAASRPRRRRQTRAECEELRLEAGRATLLEWLGRANLSFTTPLEEDV